VLRHPRNLDRQHARCGPETERMILSKPNPSGSNHSTSSPLFHVGKSKWGAVSAHWFKLLRGNVRLIYVALTLFADSDGRCWPSKKTLSEVSGIHESDIRRLLRDLEARGVIQSVERKGHSSCYQLHPPPIQGEGERPQGEAPSLHIRGGSQTPEGEGERPQGGEGERPPHNRPRNIYLNKPGDGKEKTDDESQMLPFNAEKATKAESEISKRVRAEIRAKFGISIPAQGGG